MVHVGIIMGHKILAKGIMVDRGKIEVIEKLQPSTSAGGVRSFLGYVGFYSRFIKDFLPTLQTRVQSIGEGYAIPIC